MFSNKEVFNLRPSQEILDLQQNVVNDLEQKQKDQIKELRSRVKDLLKPTHNDFYLLKWLKARKFDVTAAENMLKAHLKWRQDYRVDFIHEEYDPPEVLVKYWPFNVVGEDKDGFPILIVASGNIDFEGIMYSTQKSDLIKYHIYLLEYMDKFTISQSEKHKKLITTFSLISDVNNGKLRDFMWKPALDIMGYIHVKIFELNYPVFGNKIFAINVPTMCQVFFRMLKLFLNEELKSKMGVFGKDGWKEAVLEVVDPDQLPKHWGGNMEDAKLVMGGPIPKSYYKTLQVDKEKMKNATLPRNSMMKADIEITKPGSVISWTFKTEYYDIGFGLSFNPDGNQQNIACENQVIIPLDRANSYFVPEEGKWKCQETGTCKMKQMLRLAHCDFYAWVFSFKSKYISTTELERTADNPLNIKYVQSEQLKGLFVYEFLLLNSMEWILLRDS